MKLIERFATENPCFIRNQSITVKGLMLSTVGCAQPSAKVLVHNANRKTYTRGCMHAYIDASDGTIYQTLPWSVRGAHCGGRANETHIGITMCEPGEIRYIRPGFFELCGDRAKALAAVNRTYKSAVELFAQLCYQFMLDPLKDICSVKEGKENGIANGRGDPEILWLGLETGHTMTKFRSDVKDAVDAIKKIREAQAKAVPTPTPVIHSVAPEAFQVRIDVPNLRIRTSPEAGDNMTGKYTGVGVFTISEVQNEIWGRLSDGSGWICLDYVKKL